jgi:RNA polymerase sigma-70 factor (ECF subfamily)
MLDAAMAGDAEARRCLYLSLARPVTAFLRVNAGGDCDDLVNEVFLRVFRGLHQFSGDERGFRAWVFTIAHNVLRDMGRRRRREPDLLDLRDIDDCVGGDSEDDAMTSLGSQSVDRVLQRLTSEQREVLVLRFVIDLSLYETALAIGRPVSAVKAMQRRALASARGHLIEKH